jgi:ABC-type transporter lipoprotein component MlaA
MPDRPPRRSSSPLRRTAAAALLAILGACSVAPTAHPDRSASVTLTLTAAGLQPQPNVRLPQFGTLVFRNQRGEPVDVSVARPFAPSANCSTALHFAADGAMSVAHGVRGDNLASLCFHEAGTFPFVISDGKTQWRGIVEVAPEAAR